MIRLTRDVRRSADLARHVGGDGSAVGFQDHVRVDHRNKRVEVTFARGR
jgi:hypothetical protein